MRALNRSKVRDSKPSQEINLERSDHHRLRSLSPMDQVSQYDMSCPVDICPRLITQEPVCAPQIALSQTQVETDHLEVPKFEVLNQSHSKMGNGVQYTHKLVFQTPYRIRKSSCDIISDDQDPSKLQIKIHKEVQPIQPAPKVCEISLMDNTEQGDHSVVNLLSDDRPMRVLADIIPKS